MARFVPFSTALGVLLLLPACADLVALTRLNVASTGSVEPAGAGRSAATMQMPSGLGSGGASSEETTWAWVPGTGFVQGAPAVLARVGKPLTAAEGVNRTVDACRAVLEAEARKLGARSVEAVSAGPQTRVSGGRIAGPVLMRITYDRGLGYEVREARLTCVMDAKGRIVAANA